MGLNETFLHGMSNDDVGSLGIQRENLDSLSMWMSCDLGGKSHFDFACALMKRRILISARRLEVGLRVDDLWSAKKLNSESNMSLYESLDIDRLST